MKFRKLSRPGVIVLCSLAPATAAAVAAAVIATKLNDSTKEVEEDIWYDEYETIYDTFSSEYNSGMIYSSTDIQSGDVVGTYIVDGSQTRYSLTNFTPDRRSLRITARFDSASGTETLSINAFRTKVEFKSWIQKYADSHPGIKFKYLISKNEITIIGTVNGTVILKTSYNRHGYITYNLNNGDKCTMTYNIAPYKHS